MRQWSRSSETDKLIMVKEFDFSHAELKDQTISSLSLATGPLAEFGGNDKSKSVNLVVGTNTSSLFILNVGSGAITPLLFGHSERVSGLACHPNSKDLFATVAEDKMVNKNICTNAHF